MKRQTIIVFIGGLAIGILLIRRYQLKRRIVELEDLAFETKPIIVT